MSTTIAAVIVNLLATILPILGISVGTEQLTTTIQVLVAIGTGLWIWKQRVAVGDVNGFGMRK